MQSKKLYPPHIMFHPASPTVMASQIGLSWGGLGLLCSCCCLIWGLGVLQVLTWLDLKDLKRHIKILYETTGSDANESLAFNKCNIILCDDYVGLQHQPDNSPQWWNCFLFSLFLWLINAGVSAQKAFPQTNMNRNNFNIKELKKCIIQYNTTLWVFLYAIMFAFFK